MRKIASALPFFAVVVLMFSAVAFADMVNLSDGKAFEGKIKDFSPETFEVTIKLRGNTLAQSISEIASMSIDGDDAFNQAEKAFAANDISGAVKSYGAALKAANVDWMKQLVEVRRYQAVAKSKRIDLAVKTWIKLAETFKACEAVLAIAPANVGTEKANKTAIETLTEKVKELAADRKTNRSFIQALLKAKMKLQQDSGDNDGAAATAMILSNIDSADLTGEKPAEVAEETPAETSAETPEATASTDEEPAEKPAAAAAPAKPVKAGKTADLMVLGQLYNSGKYDVVIDSIKENIKTYDDEKLPVALTLLGRSQMDKAASMKNDKALLVEAGLNLVRVYAEYADTPSGPEALFYGAKANELLGQIAGAKAALIELSGHYAEEGQTMNPWVKKAQQELQALNASGK